MDRINELTEELSSLIKEIPDEIFRLRFLIDQLPKENLQVLHDGFRARHYAYYGDGSRKYLGKKDSAFLCDLILKEYYTARVKDLESALALFGNYALERSDETAKFLSKSAFIRDVILRNEGGYTARDLEWAAQRNKSDYHSDGLTLRTLSGHIVRSKSEEKIANELTRANLLFQYESQFDGMLTDFAILHPRKKEKYRWEHFGLIEDPDYFRNFQYKINKYYNDGFVPGKNFIMTFDTREHPLSTLKVKQLISEYFF